MNLGDLQPLFEAPPGAHVETRRLRILRRHGRPLLYLPPNPRQARISMELYPAQRRRARLARALMRLISGLGLPTTAETMSIELNPESGFAQFLKTVARREDMPDFSILSGNPNAAGRRFLLLLFDTRSQPVAVVKAGTTPKAMELIDRETRVLESLPAGRAAVPRLRGVHRSGTVRALAMAYVPGAPPKRHCEARIADLLRSWIDSARTLSVGEIPLWSQLVEACPGEAVLQAVRPRLETLPLHPVLYHGDFAPWNIRVSPAGGQMQVLDWERGELTGLPCWDWFHYWVQPGLLVQRLDPKSMACCVEAGLQSEHFRDYVRASRVETAVRELFLAYLLYNVEVIRPSEGLQQTRALLNVLAQRWGNA